MANVYAMSACLPLNKIIFSTLFRISLKRLRVGKQMSLIICVRIAKRKEKRVIYMWLRKYTLC